MKRIYISGSTIICVIIGYVLFDSEEEHLTITKEFEQRFVEESVTDMTNTGWARDVKDSLPASLDSSFSLIKAIQGQNQNKVSAKELVSKSIPIKRKRKFDSVYVKSLTKEEMKKAAASVGAELMTGYQIHKFSVHFDPKEFEQKLTKEVLSDDMVKKTSIQMQRIVKNRYFKNGVYFITGGAVFLTIESYLIGGLSPLTRFIAAVLAGMLFATIYYLLNRYNIFK